MRYANQAPPPPPGFADRFISDGWRGVERIYGARTSLLLKWIEMCGGPELHARRRQHMDETGLSVRRAVR